MGGEGRGEANRDLGAYIHMHAPTGRAPTGRAPTGFAFMYVFIHIERRLNQLQCEYSSGGLSSGSASASDTRGGVGTFSNFTSYFTFLFFKRFHTFSHLFLFVVLSPTFSYRYFILLPPTFLDFLYYPHSEEHSEYSE